MKRVRIDMPDRFIYSTRLQVRMGDRAGGVHLGNHMMVSYLNEAFAAFLREKGFPLMTVEGRSLINADLVRINPRGYSQGGFGNRRHRKTRMRYLLPCDQRKDRTGSGQGKNRDAVL